MLSVILTELGIGIFDGDTCVKTVTFSEPANDYIFIKKVGKMIEPTVIRHFYY